MDFFPPPAFMFSGIVDWDNSPGLQLLQKVTSVVVGGPWKD